MPPIQAIPIEQICSFIHSLGRKYIKYLFQATFKKIFSAVQRTSL